MVLTTKTISKKVWIYERIAGQPNAISIGKAIEISEFVKLMEARKWRDKRVLINILKIQGKNNMANFFENPPAKIKRLLNVVDFQSTLEDFI